MKKIFWVVLCLSACGHPRSTCPPTPADKNLTEEEMNAIAAVTDLEHSVRSLYVEQESVSSYAENKAPKDVADAVRDLTRQTRAVYDAERKLTAHLEAAVRRTHAMEAPWTWDARTGEIIRTPKGRAHIVVPATMAPLIESAVDGGVSGKR